MTKIEIEKEKDLLWEKTCKREISLREYDEKLWILWEEEQAAE